MAITRFSLVILFLTSSSLLGEAQIFSTSSDITTDSKPDAELILKWLGSNNPRLVAWGAYFARESNEQAAVAPMVQLVERWAPPDKDKDTEGQEKLDAMAEALDALIVVGWKPSLTALQAIESSFPAQTAVLASRLSNAEMLPLLQSWYARRKGFHFLPALPRIAAMRLAAGPPPGFAASVLAETEVSLSVSVRTTDDLKRIWWDTSSGNCGQFEYASRPDWPPIFRYGLLEQYQPTTLMLVVEFAGDRITYARSSHDSGWGSCYEPRGLNDEIWYHLIAGMLGVDKKELPWQRKKSISIDWSSDKQYLSEFLTQIALEDAAFQSTVNGLYAKGFLTKEEARSIRPELSITVFDDRKPAENPLPLPKIEDPNVTITLHTN
jgi:hypothetical protein